MKIIPIEHKHYPALFEITRISDSYISLDRNTSDRLFSQREGFVIQTSFDKVIGHITVSDYSVRHDVLIHCSVLPEYQKRWLNKSIYKEFFDYVFNDLECVRASGYAVEGINDLEFHRRLGFSWEGCIRNGFRIHDTYYNLHRYGMLKDERRW